MSQFPPPKLPEKLWDTPFASPFAQDDDSKDEKSKGNTEKSEAATTGASQSSAERHPTSWDSATPSSPRIRTKPSQTALEIHHRDQPDTASKRVENSHTAPTLSPRRGDDGPRQASAPVQPVTIASMSATKASTTHSTAGNTKTTNTTSRTTATTVTTNTGQSSKTFTSYLLPQLQEIRGKRILGYELLAKQLIFAESCGYQEPLAGSKVDSILRGKVWIREKKDISGHETPLTDADNAIIQFAEPFMAHYFDTKVMSGRLAEVTENYHGVAKTARALYQQNAYNFGKDEAVKKLMEPVIAPVVDYICGEKNTIASSKMPAPVLAMLLSLDEEVQEWYKKNGSNDPAELLKARQKALISFFGTRSFMPDYSNSLLTPKEGTPEGFYQPLTKFLNTYLNTRLEAFLKTVIDCPKDVRDRIKREAHIVESRPVLPKSEKGKIDENIERFHQRKPSSLGLRLKDAFGSVLKPADKSEVTSPRRAVQHGRVLDKETEPVDDKAPVSPRSAFNTRKTLDGNESEARATNNARKRSAAVHKYLMQDLSLSQSKELAELGDILREFNQAITKGSDKDYKSFKQNPDLSFYEFLKGFIERLQQSNVEPSTGLQRLFLTLGGKLGLDDSE